MNDANHHQQGRDLYLMLGPDFNTLHLKRCDEHLTGFEKFVLQNVRDSMQDALCPDNWMFHYQFTPTETSAIKALSGTRSRDYFRNLMPALRQYGIHPVRVIPLERARRLYAENRPILCSEREIPTLHLREFLPDSTNLDLNLARPPFNAYTAVKTHQGALIFSQNAKGARLLESLLQDIADNFFTSRIPDTEVAIYKVPAFDPVLKGYVNLWPEARRNPFKPHLLDALSPERFAPERLLRDGTECLFYGLSPRWQNFCQFVLPTRSSGLHCSQHNYDIVQLLCIEQTGRMFRSSDNRERTFSFSKEFAGIRHLSPISATDPTPMPDAEESSAPVIAARKRATDLLTSYFPNIRRQQAADEAQEQTPELFPEKTTLRHQL